MGIASPRIETALFQKRIPFSQNFLPNMSNFKATKLTQFNPPGNLQDLTPANQKKWSEEKISGWMNLEISAKYPNGDPLIGGDNVVRSPLQAFFNGTVTAYDQGAATVSIPWTAFPNRVNIAYNSQTPLRWQIADSSRIFQDEYLEWSVGRDGEGKIQTVTFSCEGPEYWQSSGIINQILWCLFTISTIATSLEI